MVLILPLILPVRKLEDIIRNYSLVEIISIFLSLKSKNTELKIINDFVWPEKLFNCIFKYYQKSRKIKHRLGLKGPKIRVQIWQILFSPKVFIRFKGGFEKSHLQNFVSLHLNYVF